MAGASTGGSGTSSVADPNERSNESEMSAEYYMRIGIRRANRKGRLLLVPGHWRRLHSH